MTTPTPPRLTGDPSTDIASLQTWAYALYQDLVVEQRVVQKLDAIAALGTLTQTISNPPTQAEVQAVQDKLNAIIEAVINPQG